MSPKAATTNSTAVRVQLSSNQVAMIWRGVDYILSQFAIRQQSGQSETSYPFRLLQLSRGFDSGAFSGRMMNRIRQLGVKLQPVRQSGGVVWLSEFELRAAVYAARTTVKIDRVKIRLAPKNGPVAQRRIGKAREALRRQVRRKGRLVESLQIRIKRATRLVKSVTSSKNFTAQSKEWQSHLKWINFHLTYFKPRPRPATAAGRLKWKREWLARLEEIANKAIVGRGYRLPKPVDLHAVISVFLDFSMRGRIGKTNHIYIVQHPDDPTAQTKLLDFVRKRLVLKEAIEAEPRKETRPEVKRDHRRRTKHRLAASDPKVQPRILLLAERWEDAGPARRGAMAAELLHLGCSIRGLAEDIGQPETSLRRYVKSARESLAKKKPRTVRKSVRAKVEVNRIPAAGGDEKQAPVSSTNQPAGNRQQLALSGKRLGVPLSPKPVPRRLETHKTAASDGPNAQSKEGLDAPEVDRERLETIDSLRRRCEEIIIRLIRVELRAQEQPPKPEEVAEVLSFAWMFMSGRNPEWVKVDLRQFESAMTENLLVNLTKPSGKPNETKTCRIGRWIATIENSLFSGARWYNGFAEVRRQLIEGAMPPEETKRDYVEPAGTLNPADAAIAASPAPQDWQDSQGEQNKHVAQIRHVYLGGQGPKRPQNRFVDRMKAAEATLRNIARKRIRDDGEDRPRK